MHITEDINCEMIPAPMENNGSEQDGTATPKTGQKTVKALIRFDADRYLKKGRIDQVKSKKWSYITMSVIKIMNLILHLENNCGFVDSGALFKVCSYMNDHKFTEFQDYDYVVIDYLGSNKSEIRIGFKADLRKLLLKQYLIEDVIKLAVSYL